MDALDRLDRVQPQLILPKVHGRALREYVTRRVSAAPVRRKQRCLSRYADDHFLSWLRTNTMLGQDQIVTKNALREAYATACLSAGRQALEDGNFSRALMSACPSVHTERRFLGGDVQERIFVGITLKGLHD